MNAGLQYYKHYYEEIDPRPEPDQGKQNGSSSGGGELSQLQLQNEKLYEMNLNDSWSLLAGDTSTKRIGQRLSEVAERQMLYHFDLKTIYPGLVSGIGYMHEINLNDALKLGFSFDHTSGLPYIPGSSVKGVLRNAAEIYGSEYDLYLPGEAKSSAELDTQKRSSFVHQVFEGKLGEQMESAYQRDVFLDAYPILSFDPDGKFLSNDYITPHINKENRKLDAFTEPVPLQFLKVLPEVVFRFSFLLRGNKNGLSPARRLATFKEMLLDLGIGAKTNVGYGQFEELTDNDRQHLDEYCLEQEKKVNKQKDQLERNKKKQLEETAHQEYKINLPVVIPKSKEGEFIEGMVEAIAGDSCFISFTYDEISCRTKKNLRTLSRKEINLDPGMQVSIIVTQPYTKDDENLICTVKPLT